MVQGRPRGGGRGRGKMELGEYPATRNSLFIEGMGDVPVPASFGGFGFPTTGYCNVGTGFVNRYHPYSQPQQHKFGFLEQLLKNRGTAQTGYIYRRSNSPVMTRAFMPNSTRSQFQPRLINGYGFPNVKAEFAPNVRPGSSVPFYQHQNWNGRGRFGYQSYQTHCNGRGSDFHVPDLPEPDEYKDYPENSNTETRYGQNHDRMTAIFDETMVNCEPIRVPLERVDLLKSYVKLLEEDIEKMKEENVKADEKYTCALQEFKDSTSRFHSDYSELCQGIQVEEHGVLVDKYYQEMKERYQKQNQESPPEENRLQSMLPESIAERLERINEMYSIKTVRKSVHPSPANPIENHLTGSVMQKEDSRVSETKVDDYFKPPFLVDIQSEENHQSEFPAQFHPHQPQNQNIGFQSHDHAELYPSNSSMVPGHYQHKQQTEYPSYPPGYFRDNGMGGFLIPSQPHRPALPPAQQQSHMMTCNISNYSNNHENHQWPGPGAHGQHEVHSQIQQNQLSFYETTVKNRPRPSVELQDFLVGLVRRTYNMSSTSASTSTIQQSEASHRQSESKSVEPTQDCSQPRLFMSGGGIVEVNTSPPESPSQQQSSIYNDSATREWINSLTHPAAAEESTDGIFANEEITEGDNEERENKNDEVDLDTLSNKMINVASGKTSKIAEILESPCLNEDSNSELQQLQQVLNVNPVDVAENTSNLDAGEGHDDDDEYSEDGLE